MISVNTKSVENWIDIAVWNDQVGGWFDLTQTRTMDDAYFEVAERAKAELAETGSVSRYLIRQTVETEVVVADVEPEPPARTNCRYCNHWFSKSYQLAIHEQLNCKKRPREARA